MLETPQINNIGEEIVNRVISTYSNVYEINQGKEPEFDKIFLPEDITSKLLLYDYNPANGPAKLHNIVINLEKAIVENKIQDANDIRRRKKNFSLLFAKNFTALNLFRISSKEKYTKYWMANFKNVGVSEYDIGHELVEQRKPFPMNFLDKAKRNIESYIREIEEIGNKDIYKSIYEKPNLKDNIALAILAGVRLEIAYVLYNKFKLNRNKQDLEELDKNIRKAFDLANLSINMKKMSDLTSSEEHSILKFHYYFIRRFYNFVGYSKRDIKAEDNNYFRDWQHFSIRLYKVLGMPYPYIPKNQDLRRNI